VRDSVRQESALAPIRARQTEESVDVHVALIDGQG
jgi:hypothetical protein